MKKTIHYLLKGSLLALGLSALSGCSDYKSLDNPQFIKDKQGRSVILRGVNIGEGNKHADGRLIDISDNDISRISEEWGWNAVRFTIFWDELMPEQGQINQDYLNAIRAQMDRYAERNIYVVVDMHQNLYGKYTGSTCQTGFASGAPAWATITDGQVDNACDGGLALLDSPAIVAAYDNFWDYAENPQLQDGFIQAWVAVAEKLKGHPAVIAYNAYNEPRFPRAIASILDAVSSSLFREGTGIDLPTNFQNYVNGSLSDFYRRWISAVRAVDSDSWLQLEPPAIPANFGVASTLLAQNFDDPRAGEERIMYAPHLYPFFQTEGIAETPTKVLDNLQLSWWNNARVGELNNKPMPVYIGEFGVRQMGRNGSSQDTLLRELEMMDRMLAGWATWSWGKGDTYVFTLLNSDGSPTPAHEMMIRPYAKATAGTPKEMSFNIATREFRYTYRHDPTINAPTEIYIPFEHVYADTWKMHVEGISATNYDYAINKQYDTINLTVKQNTAADVTVIIKNVDEAAHNYRTYKNASSGKCLDIAGANGNANVLQWDCHGGDNQQWLYEESTGHLISKRGHCLDSGARFHNGGTLKTWGCHESSNNLKFNITDGGRITPRANSGLSLEVGANHNGADVRFWASNGGNHQKWHASAPVLDDEDWIMLKVGHADKCLDIPYGKAEIGQAPHLYDCNGSDAQLWYYDKVTKHLRSKLNNMCLDSRGNVNNHSKLGLYTCIHHPNLMFNRPDGVGLRPVANNNQAVDAAGSNNFSPVIFHHINGGANQSWHDSLPNIQKLIAQDEVFRELRVAETAKCLAVKDNETANNTNVVVHACNGATGQQWYYHKPTGHFINKLGVCLDRSATTIVNGTNVRVWSCNLHPHQRFHYVRETGILQAPGLSTFSVDASNPTEDGASVHMWLHHGEGNQRWFPGQRR